MVNNESGQAAIEYILIAAITVIVGLVVIKAIKKNQYFPQMVDGPSEVLRGMVESGVWEGSAQAKKKHPGLINRKVAAKTE